MTDPRALLDALFDRPDQSEWTDAEAAGKLAAALRAVLDLQPSKMKLDGLDPETIELLTDGWKTCHAVVVRAITEALEGK